ncbi:MAG: methyltransferase domain-containing protein [Armatimonadetes bacterium]|nr:methyltransferase domain-containing protein [Armatimonadota bacterium]
MRAVREIVRQEGALGLADRLWGRGFARVASWRLGHLLGRLRNLWRLPALRRRHAGGRLNLGCGPDRRAGFLNADLGLVGDLHMDVTRPFPLADGTFGLVFSEHLLEHLDEAGAAYCLRECHRVLQPGGVLRLSTPDLARVVSCYLDPEGEGLERRRATAVASPWKYAPGAVATPAQALNDAFYLWDHRHLYDQAELTRVLREAGFDRITVYAPGEGSGELTTGLEGRKDESLVVEAVRD